MNYQELEESGYVVPMTDIVNATMLWRIKGESIATKPIVIKHKIKICNKIVNCAKTIEVINAGSIRASFPERESIYCLTLGRLK